MGFFDNKQKNGAPESSASPSPRPQPVAPVAKPTTTKTVIGPKMVVEGATKGDEDLVVEGQIKGELSCSKHVTVLQSGLVAAKIVCRSISIAGEVRGNIEAEERVTIESTGRLVGDIRAATFVNEPGGFFEGYSHMLKGDQGREDKGRAGKGQGNGPDQAGKPNQAEKHNDKRK